MRAETLSYLKCPSCSGTLSCAGHGEEIESGAVQCRKCGHQYPILAGVLVLVSDLGSYLIEHVKGISRYVDEKEIPKKYRADFIAAKRELAAEHIEEDLEAERVTSLYVMTHYLSSQQVSSSSAAIDSVIKQHWDRGPFSRIKQMLVNEKVTGRSLVELGCGVGGLLTALRPVIGSYLGLDSSFASIVLARHYALGAALSAPTLVPDDLLQGPVSREVQIKKPARNSAYADFVVCDLADPPLEAGKWQMAAALNVIDMLPEPVALPRLQHEILNAGGLAIQSCPYIWHPAVAAELRKKIPSGIMDSASAVEHLYKTCGFAIKSSEPHVPWVFFKNSRQIELYSVHLFFAAKT